MKTTMEMVKVYLKEKFKLTREEFSVGTNNDYTYFYGDVLSLLEGWLIDRRRMSSGKLDQVEPDPISQTWIMIFAQRAGRREDLQQLPCSMLNLYRFLQAVGEEVGDEFISDDCSFESGFNWISNSTYSLRGFMLSKNPFTRVVN